MEADIVLPLPPRNLLGHVTGPRRRQDHSQHTALLAHVKCEATSCHSQVPMLKMPVPGTRD
ncbi:unnamed protein product, partial [Staurois parvus]